MSDSQPEPYTFFIDRNSGGRTFRRRLVESGMKVVLHDEEFDQTSPDEEWLLEVGRRGWIVITGDKATTSLPLFVHRLAASRAYVFVLYGLNGASADGKAKCILDAMETIKSLVQIHEPPAIWRIGTDGEARCFDFRKVLNRMYRGRRL